MTCSSGGGWSSRLTSRSAALAADPTTNDAAFYEGKIATAAFFAANMLPRLTGVRRLIENLDDEIMHLPEAAF